MFDRHADGLGAEAYTRSEQVCFEFGFKAAADNKRECRIASAVALSCSDSGQQALGDLARRVQRRQIRPENKHQDAGFM